ncbi:hypothetical protein RUM44_002326 [Polyplax serrata]|uniref:Uncharacterized protein n=1 Tax=Polyplax serrata TaxID=468196 RepID=A0ABR1AMM0_POLSC
MAAGSTEDETDVCRVWGFAYYVNGSYGNRRNENVEMDYNGNEDSCGKSGMRMETYIKKELHSYAEEKIIILGGGKDTDK